MNYDQHKSVAEDAAKAIRAYLDRRNGHPDAYDVTVYGDPPTLSVNLSVIAAHALIDAINTIDGLQRVDVAADDFELFDWQDGPPYTPSPSLPGDTVLYRIVDRPTP